MQSSPRGSMPRLMPCCPPTRADCSGARSHRCRLAPSVDACVLLLPDVLRWRSSTGDPDKAPCGSHRSCRWCELVSVVIRLSSFAVAGSLRRPLCALCVGGWSCMDGLVRSGLAPLLWWHRAGRQLGASRCVVVCWMLQADLERRRFVCWLCCLAAFSLLRILAMMSSLGLGPGAPLIRLF